MARAHEQRERPGHAGDRYEALPGVTELPGYVWRRLPRAARTVVAALPLVAVVLVILLGPVIDRSKDERARSDAERAAQARAERVAQLRAEQRPRFARSTAVVASTAPPARRLAGRERVLADAQGAVLADARRRARNGALSGPIRRVDCEPFPRSVAAADADLALRSGRYSCLAVTARITPTERQGTGVIGHPYRMLIDFETGRYGYCKVSGRADEGAIEAEPQVTVPKACGGG